MRATLCCMRKLIALMLLGLFVSGCGTIRTHRTVLQPMGTELTASVGSSLFRLNKQRDLPNMWGGRDIYGGKVGKGFAEVKLIGISEGEEVEVVVFDMNSDNTETTLDRYIFSPGQQKVDVTQNVNLGDKPSEQGVTVTIDPESEPDFVVSGVKITFLEVRSNSVVYTLEDLTPPAGGGEK